MEQREQLIDRFAVAGLIEQSVQLRRRCTQSSENFPSGERAFLDPLLASIVNL
jgi:hypothetical protein